MRDVDPFVFLGASNAFFQSFCQKNHHVLFEKARRREEVHHFAHSLGGITGLLGQFTVRALQKVLAVVFSSRPPAPTGTAWRRGDTGESSECVRRQTQASTTTEPGCAISSRVAFRPVGSITSSCRTENTAPRRVIRLRKYSRFSGWLLLSLFHALSWPSFPRRAAILQQDGWRARLVFSGGPCIYWLSPLSCPSILSSSTTSAPPGTN